MLACKAEPPRVVSHRSRCPWEARGSELASSDLRRCSLTRPRLSRGLARAWRAQGRSLLTLGRLDVSLAADPGGPVELQQHDARGGERGVQSPETRFQFQFRLSFPGCVSCGWDLVSSLAG